MATMLDDPTQTASAVRMDITDGLAVIRLNDPSRPVNVISAGLLAEINAILERLEDG